MAESVSHPVFGELRWESKFAWWFTQIHLESRGRLDVIIAPGKADRLTFIEQAAKLYQGAMASEVAILRDAIQKKLLELYNVWRNEDEPELTPDGLIDQLELTFVRIDSVVPVTLGYELGKVFGGHTVDVKVDKELQFKRVDLVG